MADSENVVFSHLLDEERTGKPNLPEIAPLAIEDVKERISVHLQEGLAPDPELPAGTGGEPLDRGEGVGNREFPSPARPVFALPSASNSSHAAASSSPVGVLRASGPTLRTIRSSVPSGVHDSIE